MTQEVRDPTSPARQRALAALVAHGAKPEGLAEYVAPRRGLLRRRPATMRPLGEAWRLGSLLLDTEGGLYAVGRATRAAERGRPGYQSESREERRELAAAALRAGYPVGAPVNFDATPLPADLEGLAALDASSPIGLLEGAVRVRWRPGAPLEGAPTLDAYLGERIELLAHRLTAD